MSGTGGFGGYLTIYARQYFFSLLKNLMGKCFLTYYFETLLRIIFVAVFCF